MTHVIVHGSDGTPALIDSNGALAVTTTRNESLIYTTSNYPLYTDPMSTVGSYVYVGSTVNKPRSPIDISGYSSVTLVLVDGFEAANTTNGYYVYLLDDVDGTSYMFEHAYIVPTHKNGSQSRTAMINVNTNGAPKLYLVYDGAITPGQHVILVLHVYGHR